MDKSEQITPWLVVIEPQTLLYTRYRGRNQDVKARSPRPLTVDEIETFRLNPMEYIGKEE